MATTRDGREPTVYEMTRSELRGTIQIAIVTSLVAVGLVGAVLWLALALLIVML
jgi:hypothetical protein